MSNKKKYEKKYKCIFCDYRDTRQKLISHIETEHEDLIPEGFTATRIVFNIVNKKEYGTCVECGVETQWNEKNARYERLCDSEKCYKSYKSRVDKNMIRVYGKTHLLDDEEVQKRMLSNRKISGEYKFKDGGVRSYCGSYERKLLEFYDNVLNVESKDIVTPGPTIEYIDENGVTRKWITDLYYIPYNLAHDVKDGGSNPNTRNMPEYRSKQEYKEKAIIEQGKYNYIRLTDNNFEQLISIFLELKESLINYDTEEVPVKKLIHRIHENYMYDNECDNNELYLVPYFKHNSLIGIGITNTRIIENMYIVNEDCKIQKTSGFFLKDYDYSLLKVKNNNISINNLIDNLNSENDDFLPTDFYTIITGDSLASGNEMYLSGKVEEVIDIFTEKKIETDIRSITIFNNIENIPMLECISLKDKYNRDMINAKYKNIDIFTTIGGYIATNIVSKYTTKVYKKIENIPNSVLYTLNKMNKEIYK